MCYETDAEAPRKRRVFVHDEGGIVALIALLHISSPTSPLGVNVADALRLLALDDEPFVAQQVAERGGLQLLEDITRLAPTPSGAVAKCVALLKGQLQRASELEDSGLAPSVSVEGAVMPTSPVPQANLYQISVWSAARPAYQPQALLPAERTVHSWNDHGGGAVL